MGQADRQSAACVHHSPHPMAPTSRPPLPIMAGHSSSHPSSRSLESFGQLGKKRRGAGWEGWGGGGAGDSGMGGVSLGTWLAVGGACTCATAVASASAVLYRGTLFNEEGTSWLLSMFVRGEDAKEQRFTDRHAVQSHGEGRDEFRGRDDAKGRTTRVMEYAMEVDIVRGAHHLDCIKEW